MASGFCDKVMSHEKQEYSTFHCPIFCRKKSQVLLKIRAMQVQVLPVQIPVECQPLLSLNLTVNNRMKCKLLFVVQAVENCFQ